ncbi:methylenetetrahydrofolate reductase [NAD(P)H] [Ectothiorhodospiraceae bacterium 2226]|nr:methylenetetrahydrofolate reductase [NAD(P)H] [Ectothiorhodospiraceae bacterium 2226]
MKSQRQHPRTYSFEFFPPKTEQGKEKLRATREALGALQPRYFSVTFGAGGSTQIGTRDAVLEIQAAGFDAAPHISCIGSTRTGIAQMLNGYREAGIRRIVALRGDMPSGMGMGATGDFRYANELVAFIRETTGEHFHIEVAAYPEFHPQARSAQADLEHFKRKIDAGANAGLTQYFYSAEAYFRFIESCEALGVDVPVVPGIMPITNFAQLARFSDACGAEIPRWLRKRLEGFGDDTASIRAYGLDVVSELCQRLLDEGAPGLHFYTLNQAEPTLAIWQRLGLPAA